MLFTMFTIDHKLYSVFFLTDKDVRNIYQLPKHQNYPCGHAVPSLWNLQFSIADHEIFYQSRF